MGSNGCPGAGGHPDGKRWRSVHSFSHNRLHAVWPRMRYSISLSLSSTNCHHSDHVYEVYAWCVDTQWKVPVVIIIKCLKLWKNPIRIHLCVLFLTWGFKWMGIEAIKMTLLCSACRLSPVPWLYRDDSSSSSASFGGLQTTLSWPKVLGVFIYQCSCVDVISWHTNSFSAFYKIQW